LLATLALAPAARAHRLEGEYRVLPGRKVQVEAWFETGEAAKGAKVRIYRADGSPLFSEPGELDARGEYIFPYEKAENLKVVISAGEGHRKELTIPAAELSGPGPTPASAPQGPEETSARERAREFPFKDLLLGITFLLALGAFVLSLRNARRLRDLPRG
jgi:nickel transport protein